MGGAARRDVLAQRDIAGRRQDAEVVVGLGTGDGFGVSAGKIALPLASVLSLRGADGPVVRFTVAPTTGVVA